MKLNTKNSILIAIAALVIIGIVLAILTDKETWSRVLSFFTGFVAPLVGTVSGLVGVNTAIDKFKKPMPPSEALKK